MDATEVIALYAAVVSTGTLSWQLIEYGLRRRTNIRVELEHAYMPFDESLGEQSVDDRLEPQGYIVRVIAINDVNATEYVHNTALEARGSGACGITIDEELRPRQRISTQFWEAQFRRGLSRGVSR